MAETPVFFVGTWEKVAEVGEKAVAAERFNEDGAGDGEYVYDVGL